MPVFKQLIRKIFKSAGFEINRIRIPAPATDQRPVGRMDFLLEDLKTRGLQCKSILDVGANNGQWSVMAANIFPGAQLTLIEPQEEMKQTLSSFCEQFPGSRFFLCGAGSVESESVLTVWPDYAGSSFLPPASSQQLETGKQRVVKVVTIDSLLESGQMLMPELVKLDIQGYELEALKGAEKTFGFTEVYILEVSLFSFDDVPGMPVFSEVIKFMSERGYVVYDFPGFLRRPLDGALGQCDICFVKQRGFLRKSDRWT